ncbi:unnamed protein product [Prunus armeniaca]|uniref:Uncharacterized protein n=1 Tax=Prunus armeniaca TaxID=36596 RepID=A0A6J5V7Q1_PRUAR|nr:unnamed protein product [Prunus armeniaca]CAB4314588.1 unnamed protein product [Prunus armeniaca]
MGNSSTDDSATTGDAPPLNSSVYSEGEMILAYDAKASHFSFLFPNLHLL